MDYDDLRAQPVPDCWRNSIDRFAAYLHTAGKAETTIETRSDLIRRLARAHPDGPDSITEDDLIVWTGSRNWSPETRRSARASLRTFFAWAQHTQLREDNPAAALPSVSVGPPLPIPTPEERRANLVHVISQDVREASDQLTEALARDNSDRGLDAAAAAAREKLEQYTPAVSKPAITTGWSEAGAHAARQTLERLQRALPRMETLARAQRRGSPQWKAAQHNIETSRQASATTRRVSASPSTNNPQHRPRTLNRPAPPPPHGKDQTHTAATTDHRCDRPDTLEDRRWRT
ncbi:MAG: phage integrase N-terminal SAM-like domain-containing protein [bacterium]|nr:phage integrase N-terminal SAM-like domain-containing protein [bacterium]